MESRKNDIYYVWLSLVLGQANIHSSELLNGFDSIDLLYECMDYSAFFLPERLEERLLNKDLSASVRIVEKCHQLNIGILTYESDLFPERIRQIRDVPPVLYYIGSLKNLEDEVCVTFVGTRKASSGGQLNAEQIAFGCAKCGITVISGLAKGIDRACHRGALLADKYTVGFSGVAIDKIFPKSNTDLYHDMYKHGVVFSEFPPGAETNKSSFPARNRLLNALGRAVVVVESPARSGSLITASMAMSSGKTVFAVPGDIKVSPGTNHLISEGALVVQSYKDIVKRFYDVYPTKISFAPRIDEYFPIIQRDFSEFSKEKKELLHIKMPDREDRDQSLKKDKNSNDNTAANTNSFDDCDDDERAVADILKENGALALDDILSISDASFDRVIAALTLLEINGVVVRDKNGLYRLS